MRLFRRGRPVTDADLGVGTALRVATVDGRPAHLVTWDRDLRKGLDEAQPGLRFLRAAGVAGEVDLRTEREAIEAAVRLGTGRALRIVVDPSLGFEVLPDDGVAGREPGAWVHPSDHPEPVDPVVALGEVALAVSSLVAGQDGCPVVLRGPVTANGASVQLLRGSGALPARWAVCVFVTRDHHVPEGTDRETRSALWVEHSVGIKLHLDGTIAADPDDDDPSGERSRASLATASAWAGEPLDLLPYARWLVEETERRIGRSLA